MSLSFRLCTESSIQSLKVRYQPLRVFDPMPGLTYAPPGIPITNVLQHYNVHEDSRHTLTMPHEHPDSDDEVIDGEDDVLRAETLRRTTRQTSKGINGAGVHIAEQVDGEWVDEAVYGDQEIYDIVRAAAVADFAAVRLAFKTSDVDHDGILKRSEVPQFFQRLGIAAGSAQATALLHNFQMIPEGSDTHDTVVPDHAQPGLPMATPGLSFANLLTGLDLEEESDHRVHLGSTMLFNPEVFCT